MAPPDDTGTERAACAASRRSACRLATVILIVTLAVTYTAWIAGNVAADLLIDFNVYYIAGESYALGLDPYEISNRDSADEWGDVALSIGIVNYTKPFRYPPQAAMAAMLLRPLRHTAASVVWDAASAAAMILAAWLLGRTVGGGWWTPASLAALLGFSPAFNTLSLGQMNGFIFLALVVALWGLARGDGWKGAGWAGGCLAIGISLKVVPVLFVPFLALWRRWKALACLAAAMVALFLVSLPVVGFDAYVSYADHFVDLSSSLIEIDDAMNQTPRAVLERVLGYQSAYADDIALAISALLVLLSAWLCRPTSHSKRWLAVEFALVTALTTLVLPLTFFHQFIVLLLPLMVVAEELWRRGSVRILGALLTLYALTSMQFLRLDFARVIDPDSPLAWLNEFPFLFALSLWLAAAWLIDEAKRRPDERPEPADGAPTSVTGAP